MPSVRSVSLRRAGDVGIGWLVGAAAAAEPDAEVGVSPSLARLFAWMLSGGGLRMLGAREWINNYGELFEFISSLRPWSAIPRLMLKGAACRGVSEK